MLSHSLSCSGSSASYDAFSDISRLVEERSAELRIFRAVRDAWLMPCRFVLAALDFSGKGELSLAVLGKRRSRSARGRGEISSRSAREEERFLLAPLGKREDFSRSAREEESYLLAPLGLDARCARRVGRPFLPFCILAALRRAFFSLRSGESLRSIVARHSLFCPTVGPILSGPNPGTSLYSVFTLSKNVYPRISAIPLPFLRLTVFPAYPESGSAQDSAEKGATHIIQPDNDNTILILPRHILV